MKQATGPIVLFIFALAILITSSCLFTLDMTKTAIVTQFGDPKKVHTEPGLKFKLPWPIQEVQEFDKRILNIDPQPERVNLSSDTNNPILQEIKQEAIESGESVEEVEAKVESVNGGAPIFVDTFARYRIIEPLEFLKTFGTERTAENRIENIMNAATRDILGKTTLGELLSEQRSDIMARIRDRVNAEMSERGVEIVDIRIVRADLTDRLRDSTVNRMITERKEQATKTRATGQERALEIKSTADKERAVLLANAQRDSQIIRGRGDNKAITTYAEAFNKDKEFYSFIRSMEAYRNTLANPETRLILSPDSDFLRYFQDRDQ